MSLNMRAARKLARIRLNRQRRRAAPPQRAIQAAEITGFEMRWSGTGPLTLVLQSGARVPVHRDEVLAAPWFAQLRPDQRESLAVIVSDWCANAATSMGGGVA